MHEQHFVNQISPIYISFGIPEDRLADLRHYLAQGTAYVEARTPGEPASKGRVTFVDNSIDHTTGTIRLKGTFPNDDRRLWPGQFVDVFLVLTTDPKAIVIPTRALQTRQQGPYVFVVKPDRTAELPPVAVARFDGDDTVIASGLAPGETVVTDGQSRLVRGSAVTVKSATAGTVPDTE